MASIEGTVNGAGSAIEWFREVAEIDPERALQSLPAYAPDDLPLFLNGVGGVGSPYWQPEAPIEFVGNSDDRQRLMAVLESVAFLLDVNLRAMSDAAKVTRVLVTGGLARADYLCQVLADVSGLTVIRSSVREPRRAAPRSGSQPGWSDPRSTERSHRTGAARNPVSRWRSPRAAPFGVPLRLRQA
jgi:glycerol kinase